MNLNIFFDIIIANKNAPVAELADAPDLGSGISRCAGSSPVRCTRQPQFKTAVFQGENKMKSRLFKALLYISGFFTAVICLAMNFFIIPKIEAGADGLRWLEIKFGYSEDYVIGFIMKSTSECRDIITNVQIPLDLFYMVCYGLFFSLLIIALLKKKTWLIAFPVTLSVVDLFEDLTLMNMFKSSDYIRFSGILTSVKTILMYICFLIIILLIIYRIKQHIEYKKGLPD